MVVLPAHRGLQNFVQLGQRGFTGELDPPPDWRGNVEQEDVQTVDGHLEHPVQLRSVAVSAGDLVAKDLVAPGLFQDFELARQLLVFGRDAGITNLRSQIYRRMVERELIADFKRVSSKNNLLFQIAEASLEGVMKLRA